MDLYFFAIIPMQIIPSIGISEIARSLDDSIKTHLIHPDHPYAKNMCINFLNYFDSVDCLPDCYYQKNIFKGLRNMRRLQKAAELIPIEPNSIYFFFADGANMTQILFKHRVEKAKNVIKVKIFHCPSYFSKDRKMQLRLVGSLMASFYSLLAGGPVVRMLLQAGSLSDNQACYFSRDYHDLEIQLENASSYSLASTKPKPLFANMPYPARAMNLRSEKNIPEVENNAIIFFTSAEPSVGFVKESEYHDFYRKILSVLSRKFKNNPLYLKLHPAEDKELFKNFGISGWTIIESRCCAEEFISFNLERIAAVFTTFSSSAINAAYFGLPAYGTFPISPIESSTKEIYRTYYSVSPDNLKVFNSWEELEEMEIPPAGATMRESQCRTKWSVCLGKMFEKVKEKEVKV